MPASVRWLAAVVLVLCSCGDATPPGSWTSAPPLPQERYEAHAMALRGRIYFFGGITDLCPPGESACVSDHVDVFDPTARQWSPGPPLPPEAPRHHLAMAQVGDTIYLLGGFTGILAAQNFMPLATTFSFDGTTWRRLADQPLARGSATAEAIGGKIYVAGGGIAEPDARADLYAYDPSSDTWAARAPMPTAREHVASCPLADTMLVVGGWLGDRTVVHSAESYDPATDHWTTLPDLPTARGGLGARPLRGLCFAIGGEEWSGPLPGTFADVQGFDPRSGRWTTYAPLPHARHGLGVAALGDSLYAVGGGDIRGNSYTTLVEIFTP